MRQKTSVQVHGTSSYVLLGGSSGSVHTPSIILAQAWLPARTYVQEAIEKRYEVDPSGEIIKLPHYCPWKEHLYDLEEEMALDKPIKFCIYEVGNCYNHYYTLFLPQACLPRGSFDTLKMLWPRCWPANLWDCLPL